MQCFGSLRTTGSEKTSSVEFTLSLPVLISLLACHPEVQSRFAGQAAGPMQLAGAPKNPEAPMGLPYPKYTEALILANASSKGLILPLPFINN